MRNLRISDAGKRFTAKIQGASSSGRVQFEEDSFYLCQNEKNGSRCKNKLGYEFSWTIGDGTTDTVKVREVEDLKIQGWTEKEINKYKDFQVGDELASDCSYNRTIVAKFGERFLVADTDDGKASILTAQELYDNDWRLNIEPEEDEEPETVELSVAEVAEKLGIDAKTLKIVDNK